MVGKIYQLEGEIRGRLVFFFIEYTTFYVVGMAICVVGKTKGTLILCMRETN